MDVASIVTGDVGAEGVKGEVVVRDLLGDLTLEVADESRGRGRERGGHRMHEQVDRIRPAHGAPQEAELVAAHRDAGPATMTRGDASGPRRVVVLLLRLHPRNANSARPAPTGSSMRLARSARAPLLVTGGDPSHVRHHHAAGIEVDGDGVG